MGLPAEEPGTNGRGSDVSKATYSKVTKNSSTPNKPDVALPGGEARQQQPGGVTPVELSKALSDGTEQKTVKATPKESPNQAPPQQQSTREGGPRQAQVPGCGYMCLCVCACMRVCVYVCTLPVPVCGHMYPFVCVHACMCTCTCVCLYVWVWVYYKYALLDAWYISW